LIDLEGKDGLSLNQERKDEKMSRILSILASFLSWFKTNFLSLSDSTKHPVNPCILPFHVPNSTKKAGVNSPLL